MKEKNELQKENYFVVAPNVWGMRDIFVNVYMISDPLSNSWVLVDAGLKWSTPKIKKMAAQLFNESAKPSAIILTHGHFDHIGALRDLADEWDVQVYAHALEMPYLTGKSSYPPADPTVEGGMMATMSFVYPDGPVDISDRINYLPEDGSVPGLLEWEYIHTPGHAPGHISLFRRLDKVLIAGDAFVTTQQESMLSVMFQWEKVCGPPKYFTPDWVAAGYSVKKLADLEPEVVATGHGKPMRGTEMKNKLHELANSFEKVAVPSSGRYVDEPAVMDETGVVYVPEKKTDVNMVQVLGLATGLLLAWIVYRKVAANKRKSGTEEVLDTMPSFQLN